MNLIIFLIITLFLSLNIDENSLESTENTATLIFYRKGQFAGALQNYNVYVNGQKLCKISNGKYFSTQVIPGEIFFTSKAGGLEVFKKKENFSIEAEAGQTYYVECNLMSSITRYRMEFTEVTANTAKRKLQGLEEDNCMAVSN